MRFNTAVTAGAGGSVIFFASGVTCSVALVYILWSLNFCVFVSVEVFYQLICNQKSAPKLLIFDGFKLLSRDWKTENFCLEDQVV